MHVNLMLEPRSVRTTQPTEVEPTTVSEYFASSSKGATGTQPPISCKLAKKMRHFLASAIAESEVEQGYSNCCWYYMYC